MNRSLLLVGVFILGLMSVSAPAADKFKPDAGFTRIDNGKDLNGWMGDRKNWSVNSDGIIGSKGKPKNKSAIYSEKNHDDSVTIRLEFKAAAGSRGAVLVHGKQLQIGDFEKTGPRDYAPAAKAIGQWNDLEFDITKGQAVVKLNGKVVEKSWQIGRESNKGIGLEHEIGEIEFRHLQMKDKK